MIRPLLTFVATFLIATVAAATWHIYNIPRAEFARLEVQHLETLGAHNVFGHRRDLVDHTFTEIVRPNNDTLYSSAFLDLSGGPLLLTVPETGARYYSIQFMDPMTEVYSVISRRTHGGVGGVYEIVAADQTDIAPGEFSHTVVAPTNRSWVLVRFLIDGEADLPAVHALQDRLVLSPAID